MARKTPLLPKHPHGALICQIFNYQWKWIESPLLPDATRWETNTRYPIRPRSLWRKYLNPNILIGTRFGNQTRYAMIDIDHGSPLCTPEGVAQVRSALETVGIVRTITIRSSWSQGIHIYGPLPQAYPTFSVATMIRQALEAQGLHLAPGHLEAFPNEKAYGKGWLGQYTEYNGHRLPLQPGSGSCLVDGDLEPVAGGYDLARFLAIWEMAQIQNCPDELGEALVVARANRRRRRSPLGKKAKAWWEDLGAEITEGWTGPGQTNGLLKSIATYGRVFERLAGAGLVDYVIRVARNCPGFDQWCAHTHEITNRALAWARAVEKFYWPIGDSPTRGPQAVSPNQARTEDARQRIKAAVRACQFIGKEWGVTQLAHWIAGVARCSLATLYRHLDLWHPDRGESPVMPHTASDPATLAEVQALVRQSLESVDKWGITGNRGGNEVFSLNTAFKNSPPEGERGGRGGREGLSTGWLPRMDWKPGPVNGASADA